MAPRANPEEIRKLEQELRELFARENYAEALDVYDEIERLGVLRPAHLVGKGQCLLKLRRKQDAKRAFVRAFDLDANFQPAQHMLDQHFPGWEKTYVAPEAAPPPPGAAQQVIVVQQAPPPAAWSPAQPPAGYAPAPPPATYSPAQPPVAAQGPQPIVIMQQAAPPSAQVGRPQAPGPDPTDPATAKINWRYVLEDVEAERLARAG